MESKTRKELLDQADKNIPSAQEYYDLKDLSEQIIMTNDDIHNKLHQMSTSRALLKNHLLSFVSQKRLVVKTDLREVQGIFPTYPLGEKTGNDCFVNIQLKVLGVPDFQYKVWRSTADDVMMLFNEYEKHFRKKPEPPKITVRDFVSMGQKNNRPNMYPPGTRIRIKQDLYEKGDKVFSKGQEARIVIHSHLNVYWVTVAGDIVLNRDAVARLVIDTHFEPFPRSVWMQQAGDIEGGVVLLQCNHGDKGAIEFREVM